MELQHIRFLVKSKNADCPSLPVGSAVIAQLSFYTSKSGYKIQLFVSGV